MFNYATKSDLKGVPSIDTSKFTEKADLATLKSVADDFPANNRHSEDVL